MVELRRIVRILIGTEPDATLLRASATNAYAGIPALDGLGAWFELEVCCAGVLDPRTGYLEDIKTIDRAARSVVTPVIQDAFRSTPGAAPASVLARAVHPLNAALRGRLSRVIWKLTPYYSIEMPATDQSLVLIRQRFDFAAAHRLDSPHLTAEQNREIFGKCNNPSGHGHNYQIEPCVAVALAPDGRQTLTLTALEAIVERVIISRFDHKHLNVDTEEFGPKGVNPTVENIAKVFFELLSAALRADGSRAQLRSMTVWETDRTCCTYPA